jgi:signal transduction histidine kinase
MKNIAEKMIAMSNESLLGSLTEPKFMLSEIIDALKDNYSSFLTQSSVLLIVVNEDFTVKYISNMLCHSLHRPKNTLLNESMFSFANQTTKSKIAEVIEDLKGKVGKKRKVSDLVFHCIYNVEHYFDGLVLNLVNDPRIGGYLFYLNNVSVHKKVESQLKDLNLELDSFVYKASHDLRAPLTSLAGLINITESDFPPQAWENFSLMKRSVTKLDKFISQLANYSRNTNTENEYSQINFELMIGGIIENYKHLKDADKIDFQLVLNIKSAVVSDSFRLQTILNNLISNAIKYHQVSKNGPFIRIEIEEIENSITIKVRDNGRGISQEYVNKVFDMFMRASHESDGSGLGLYIVKKALEKLDGKIYVQSIYGEGSTFTVILPLQERVIRSSEAA